MGLHTIIYINLVALNIDVIVILLRTRTLVSTLPELCHDTFIFV